MKTIFQLIFFLLVFAVPALAQPSSGSSVKVWDGAQTADVTAASALKVDNSAVTQPVSGTFFQATQPVSGTFFQATQPVSGTLTCNAGTNLNTSALATSALQTTGNSSLSSLDGKTPALGQALAASSSPVVLTAAQMTTLTPLSTVAATQSGTWTVQPGNTANTTAWKVDGSAVTQPVSGTFWQATQPVSGTVAATQSGTWNITNVSGTVSLPTGAATAAKQPALGTAGTSSADVITVQGRAAMTPLLVDGSASTQPVSGTVSAAQSGTWTVQPGNTANTTAWKVDGSAVTQPVSGTFWQTTQPVSGTVAATQSGTWNVTNVSGTVSLPTGASTSANQSTEITSLQLLDNLVLTEDLASTTLDPGVQCLAVRASSPANTSGTNGDYEPLQVNAGRLWTSTTIDAALPAGSAVIGHVIADSGSTTTVTGNVTVVQPTGTNLHAVLDSTSTTAVTQATGTNLHAVVDSGTVSTITNVVHVDDNASSLTVDGTVATTQSGTWTVQPGNTANTTAWKVDASSVAVPVTDNSGSLTVDAPLATPVFATLTPNTTGGWSVGSQTALTSTKAQIKGTAGTFGGYMVYNGNAAVEYIQVWDLASASVTVGTTAPTYVIPVPATSGANLEITNGINHATGITVAFTTTPTGSGNPGTALVGFFLYK